MKKTLLIAAFLFSGFCFIQSVTAGPCCSRPAPVDPDRAFIDSFLRYYEFNAAGRYAHEYHPYLLQKTANSLRILENKVGEYFQADGRLVIMGYEGNAIPRYVTNFHDCEGDAISDEVALKTRAGWAPPPNNRFGLMTGFLFRNAENIDVPEDRKIFHLRPETIEIFGDGLDVFQEDAFGEACRAMRSAERKVLETIKAGHPKNVFEAMRDFWKKLYFNATKGGDQQVTGTQDILFSVAHAGHLRDSKVPLTKFYVGADPTYPIIPTTRCSKKATDNAQLFVKIFIENLKPSEGKKTVYIFNSFVDGVGKSTMLGNIKNWMKHGEDVDSYDAVDNTSSQLSEIFEFAPNVYIADLPAQISHFTYKPDGQVFVDVHGIKHPEDEVDAAKSIFRYQRSRFVDEYHEMLNEVKRCGMSQSAKHPAKDFVRNVIILKKEKTNQWIPFESGNHWYIGNLETEELRVCVSLPDAQSSGLKNVEAEQMLFWNGVSLPFSYDVFVKDLVDRCRDKGVERVIFVDFLSMYSRSSRENVRVNYLLQQLGRMDQRFDMSRSLYCDLSGEAELFALFKKPAWRAEVEHNLKSEVLTRLALNKLMEGHEAGGLEHVDIEIMTGHLNNILKDVSPENMEYLNKLVREKVATEIKALEAVYGMTKAYLNVHEISIKEILKFSKKLQELFEEVKNIRVRALWRDFGDRVVEGNNKDEGDIDRIIVMNNNERARAIFVMSPDNRDPSIISGFADIVRSSWYASLSNFVWADEKGVPEHVAMLPVVVKKGTNGKIYILQKLVPVFDRKLEDEFKKPHDHFLSNVDLLETRWGAFDGRAYPIDIKPKDTSRGVYAYATSKASKRSLSPYLEMVQDKVFHDYHTCRTPEWAMTASECLTDVNKRLQGRDSWVNSILERAKKNNAKQKEQKEEKKDKKDKEKKKDSSKDKEKEEDSEEKEEEKPQEEEAEQFEFFDSRDKQLQDENDSDYGYSGYGSSRDKLKPLSPQQQVRGAAVFVRYVATLEAILRSPASNVAVRRWNQNDFEASAKLIEKTVLPQYFGFVVTQPLFRGAIKPVIDLQRLVE